MKSLLHKECSMIYKTPQHQIAFETRFDYDELCKVRYEFKRKANGNEELFKQLVSEYIESLPLRE